MTRLLLIAFACIVLASAVQPQKDEERKTCDVGEDGNCVSDNCVDNFEKCPEWAEQGECGSNPFYMMLQCKKSCNTCSFDPLELDKRIEYASRLHKVGGDAELLETEYGIAQDPPQGYSQAMVDSVTAEMKAYMDTVYSDPELHELMDLCKNRKRNCLRWKLDGRCAESDELKKMCAPFCKACQLLDYKFRCPINESIPVALKPGDLDKLFQRIVTDQYLKKFNPTILSMPNATSPEIVNGPWIVTLDDFLSDQEADQFIELGAGQSFRRSADVSGLRFDGKFQSKVSDHRTSTNAWCYPPCEYNATTIEVTQRIVHLTGITAENFEWYQLLRYEPGQYYNQHHDYTDFHLQRMYGPRILTVFLYLNNVDKGGGTNFPFLNLTVQPKKGSAVIWPSVLNEDPFAKDERTEHAALPVEEGIKYGANTWIHLRDYKTPSNNGCN